MAFRGHFCSPKSLEQFSKVIGFVLASLININFIYSYGEVPMRLRHKFLSFFAAVVSMLLAVGVTASASATPVIVATIPTSTYPTQVAMSNNGDYVYSVNYLGDLSIIDTSNNSVVNTTRIPGLTNCYRMAVNPVTNVIYLLNNSTTQANNKVITVDVSGNTPTVTSTFTAGWNSFAMAVSPDGSRLYVGNNYSSVNTIDNSVSVINTSTNSVVAAIQPPAAPTTAGGVLDAPNSIVVSPDNSRVYVGYYDDDASSTTVPGLASFSSSTHSLINAIELATTFHPYALDISSDGQSLYLGNWGTVNTASILKYDLQAAANFSSFTNTLTGTNNLYALALSADDSQLYTSFSVNPGVLKIYPTATMASPNTIAFSAGITSAMIAPALAVGSHFAYVGSSSDVYLIGEYLSQYRQTLTGGTGALLTSTAITATGFSGTVTYSISPGLPAGFTFDTSTGVVTGSSTTALGPTTFTITGTNGSSSAIATVNLTVTAPGGSGGSGGSSPGLANTGNESKLPIALFGLMFLLAGISVYSGSIVVKNRVSK